jgi:3-oxoacyl-[acyl-carrier-protein] synthase II
MQKVAITGLGAVTPVGNSVIKAWQAIVQGRSGVGRITHFDPSDFQTQIAAQVKDFTPQPYLTRKEARRLDRLIHFAVAAAGEAVDNANLMSYSRLDLGRVGVIVGAGIGGMQTMIDGHHQLLKKGPRGVSPFFIPAIIANMPGGIIAEKFGFTGPNFAVTSACATGNHAIGQALSLVRHGTSDVVICGGAEAPIVTLGIAGFNAMRALSTNNDDPTSACRPFDKARDGFVMGEGAGILVLESMEHARSRGARIYAELAGYGTTADAYHLVAPDPDGKGAIGAMKLALQDARMDPADIDYVNAHGTGTELNDPIETRAIKTVFGQAAFELAISSTKAVTGHLLGGASALEAVITTLSVHENIVPPTINLTDPDPECDLDYIPLTAREIPVHAAISNGFGFGGHNATIVIRSL